MKEYFKKLLLKGQLVAFFTLILSIKSFCQDKEELRADKNGIVVAISFMAEMRFFANDQMSRQGVQNIPKVLTNDPSYLGGTLAALMAPPLSWLCLRNYSDSNKFDRNYGEIIYLLSNVFSYSFWGINDAKMWMKWNGKPLPEWLSDKSKFYIGTEILASCAPQIAVRYWNPKSKFNGICKTFSAAFIGGVCWDMAFSKLRYGDLFYPVPNWYGGHGFKNKEQRIFFDVARISLAGLTYFLPDIISSVSGSSGSSNKQANNQVTGVHLTAFPFLNQKEKAMGISLSFEF